MRAVVSEERVAELDLEGADVANIKVSDGGVHLAGEDIFLAFLGAVMLKIFERHGDG